MARDGWLRREDLVWNAGMPEWTPAGKVPGLFASSLGQILQDTIAGVRAPVEAKAAEAQQITQPPGIPAEIPKPIKANKPRPKSRQAEIDWEDLRPRDLLAACGGFLAALRTAFTVTARSRLALDFTLSGLINVAAGLYVETGRLLGQAIENIGEASKEAADRRLRAKELATRDSEPNSSSLFALFLADCRPSVVNLQRTGQNTPSSQISHVPAQ